MAIDLDSEHSRARDAIGRLLEAISDLVAIDSIPWPNKRDMVSFEASENQWTDVGEFLCWFENEVLGDDEDEEEKEEEKEEGAKND